MDQDLAYVALISVIGLAVSLGVAVAEDGIALAQDANQEQSELRAVAAPHAPDPLRTVGSIRVEGSIHARLPAEAIAPVQNR
jgi:hypothetical protein